MSKKLKLISAAVSVLLLAAALVFAAFWYYRSADIYKSGRFAVQSGDYEYVIKSEDRRVYAYRLKDNKLICELDVDADMLPEADRSQLEKGMYIKDKKALNRIIEDLTG